MLQRQEVLQKLRELYGNDKEEVALVEDWLVDLWTTIDELRLKFGPLATRFMVEARGPLEDDALSGKPSPEVIGDHVGNHHA